MCACATARARRFALLFALGPVFAATPALGLPERESAKEFWYRGRVDLRYVLREAKGGETGGSESDQDLTQDLFLEAGSGSALRFEASGRVQEDIDGRRGVSVFRDLYDTYGDIAHGYLYTAYGEARDRGPIARARLGRQYLADELEVRFDGGLVETVPLADAMKFTLYGGIPANLYEASVRGDYLAGAAAELVAIPRASVRLDYVHLTDYRGDLKRLQGIDGVPRSAVRDDDFFALTLGYRLTDKVRLRGRASTFEGRSSRFEGELYFYDRAIDLSFRLRYTGQLGAYRDLSVQFSPLDEVLSEYEPYHEGYADIRKGIGEHFAVGGGLAIRELQYELDEGPFNHEFRRCFLFAELTDLPWKGLGLSGRAEWYGSDRADRTLQLSGELLQEIGPFAAGAGTSYARYRFDEFFLEERESVRTYFANLEWRPTKSLRARTGYSFEKDDEENFHVARLEVRLEF